MKKLVVDKNIISLKKKIRGNLRRRKDWPKPGINFIDITPVLADPQMFRAVVSLMASPFKDKEIDYVLAPEARGFIFGGAIAAQLGCGLVMARKKAKYPPFPVIAAQYSLEYGEDSIVVPRGFMKRFSRVLIVDDVLATGGTVGALENIVKCCRAVVIGHSFLIELEALKGRNKLESKCVKSVLIL